MTSPRELLDRFAPLRTPERLAAWLCLAAALVLAIIASPALPGWPSAQAEPSPGPSATSSSPRPSAAASPVAADLRSVATVETRLATLADALRTELEANQPNVGVMVGLLRQVNATLVAGSGAVDGLAGSPATQDLGESLVAAHEEISAVISATLAQSLSDQPAYEAGGRQVLALIDGLAPLDAQIDELLSAG